MAPITITVIDSSGKSNIETVGSDKGLDKKLARYKAACFVHETHGNVDDFESLVPNGTYRLGPLNQQQQLDTAFDIHFTILRDNRQADGLRKLLTIAAAKHTAFYTSIDATTQILHGTAFKSETIPEDLDISSWSQSGDGCPRLLSVNLHFLSREKVAAFEGEVIQLLQDRPSAVLVDMQTKTLSPGFDTVVNVSPAAPIKLAHAVHDIHYVSRQSTTSVSAPGEPFDSKDECDLTVTVTATLPPGLVGNFDENDPLWPSHAIEKRSAFVVHAEKAHIFPHNECTKTKQKDGKRIKVTTNYEWLDDPTDAEFNFLYLSPSMHLCFDGSGHGRGVKSATQSAICIEPLARNIDDGMGIKRFKIEKAEEVYLATIPLRVWCRSEDVATRIKPLFANGVHSGFDQSTGLHYFENISVECVHRQIFMGREEILEGESRDRIVVYNKRVPSMDEQLSGAWSLTENGTLSSTEIMEKCFLWTANQTWNDEWKGTVTERIFMSRTE